MGGGGASMEAGVYGIPREVEEARVDGSKKEASCSEALERGV